MVRELRQSRTSQVTFNSSSDISFFIPPATFGGAWLGPIRYYLDSINNQIIREYPVGTNAIIANNLAEIKSIFQSGIDIDYKLYKNYTALHYAVLHNRHNIIKWMIDSGADINTHDTVLGCGFTPLIDAIIHNYGYTTKILINAGADVNARDAKGRTALHHSARGRLYTYSVLLIDAGADIHARDDEGLNVLHYAATHYNICLAEKVIKLGIAINDKTTKGDAALDIATWCGYGEFIKVLLDAGANVNIRCHGFTPFCVACSEGFVGIARMLLEAGSKIDVICNSRTPLEWAQLEHNTSIINLITSIKIHTYITNIWDTLYSAYEPRIIDIIIDYTIS